MQSNVALVSLRGVVNEHPPQDVAITEMGGTILYAGTSLLGIVVTEHLRFALPGDSDPNGKLYAILKNEKVCTLDKFVRVASSWWPQLLFHAGSGFTFGSSLLPCRIRCGNPLHFRTCPSCLSKGPQSSGGELQFSAMCQGMPGRFLCNSA